jgi:hypothetical protein
LIAVTSGRHLENAAVRLEPGFRWCYFGRDPGARRKVCDRFGEESRMFLGSMVHDAAMKLRTPFLDFMAALGRRQRDSLNWWASKFASRSPFQSDFFLHLCYYYSIERMIEGHALGDSDICLVVEDAWLYRELKVSCPERSNVVFCGGDSLLLERLFRLARGGVFRVLLAGWLLVAKCIVSWSHRGERPGAPDESRAAVGIVTYGEKRAFREGGYVDQYTGELAALLAEHDVPSFYIWYIVFPLSTALMVGRNRGNLWPMVLDVRLTDVLKRMVGFLSIRMRGSSIDVDGKSLNIDYLIRGQWWNEFSDTGFNARLIWFDALVRFFKKEWCRSLVCVFENQPHEKVLCMAASSAGVKTTAYQHSSISRFYMSQFLGHGEVDLMPLPDRLLTTGEYFSRLYVEAGVPSGRVAVGGAWRYPHLTGTDDRRVAAARASDKVIVLVALPVDVDIAKSLLKAVKVSFAGSGFDIWIKTHPDVPFSRLVPKRAAVDYMVVDFPLEDLLVQCDVLITSASTAGLEAFLYGKRVVVYVPENLLVPDPLMDIEDGRICLWYEGEGLDIAFVSGKTDKDISGIGAGQYYYEKVREDEWLGSVLGD